MEVDPKKDLLRLSPLDKVFLSTGREEIPLGDERALAAFVDAASRRIEEINQRDHESLGLPQQALDARLAADATTVARAEYVITTILDAKLNRPRLF